MQIALYYQLNIVENNFSKFAILKFQLNKLYNYRIKYSLFYKYCKFNTICVLMFFSFE